MAAGKPWRKKGGSKSKVRESRADIELAKAYQEIQRLKAMLDDHRFKALVAYYVKLRNGQ